METPAATEQRANGPVSARSDGSQSSYESLDPKKKDKKEKG